MTLRAVYTGIDVSKNHADVAVRPAGQMWTISNDKSGIRELVSRLKALDTAIVVLESTGGLELPSVAALVAAALPVAIVNPRQVRDFAKGPPGSWARPTHWTRWPWPASLTLFVQWCASDAETHVLSSLVARKHQVSEVGTLNRRQVAALVGVAPFNPDSGALRDKRQVWGGRARLRAVLYMEAMVAS